MPADLSETSHSGTGRFAWLTMRNMSLFESKESTGEVSFRDLFDGKQDIEGTNTLNINRLAYIICRGGWPDTLGLKENMALEVASDYLDGIVNSDISKVG